MKYLSFICLVVASLLTFSCGDDDTPLTPPIEEWCDVDRPREDCTLRDARIQNQEDMIELCQSTCNRVSTLIVQNHVDNEILKGLQGFTQIDSLIVSSTHKNVVDLSFLRGVKKMFGIKIMDNPGLVNLSGIEGVEFIRRCEEKECFRKIELTANPKLQSLKGLENVKNLEHLVIMDNPSLEEINGVDSLESSILTIINNGRLKKIAGFAGMIHTEGMKIQSNPQLKHLELWQNLKTIEGLSIDRNPSLNMCDVDRILGQLERPPTGMDIPDTNGPPCTQ